MYAGMCTFLSVYSGGWCLSKCGCMLVQVCGPMYEEERVCVK